MWLQPMLHVSRGHRIFLGFPHSGNGNGEMTPAFRRSSFSPRASRDGRATSSPGGGSAAGRGRNRGVDAANAGGANGGGAVHAADGTAPSPPGAVPREG